jgi:hypothetical protein
MCKAASFIVTKNKILWVPWCDSHEIIIKEHGLNDRSDSPDFVRIEISPKDDNYRLPFNEWVFRRDQDLSPDWYSDKWAEEICRKELSTWAEAHIISKGKFEIECAKDFPISVIVIGGEVTIINQSGGDCRAYESATLNASNQSGGYCRAYGSAMLNASNQSGGDCRAYESATLNRIK